MKKEKLIILFLGTTSFFITFDFLISLLLPELPAELLGEQLSEYWLMFINANYIAWVIFLVLLMLSFLILTATEKLQQHRYRISTNTDMEYVLSEYQKQQLLLKECVEISLVFNSAFTGFSMFDEERSLIKFDVRTADEDEAELALKGYFEKHFDKQISVSKTAALHAGRWQRKIRLN